MRTSQNTAETINTIGIDVGKNTFHLVGLDKRGAIVLQQKVTRHQLGRRLSNISRCLIGMETCSGTHFIARQLAALGHDVRLIPAQYVKPFLKGHKNDYRDARTVSSRICFRAWISSPGWIYLQMDLGVSLGKLCDRSRRVAPTIRIHPLGVTPSTRRKAVVMWA